MLRRRAAGEGIVGKGLGIDVVLRVRLGVAAAVPEVLNGLSGGQQAVLVALGLSPVRIPPEYGALALAAVDAVNIVHLPAFQILICLRAAAGVDQQGVMAQGQLQVIGSGGADAGRSRRRPRCLAITASRQG